ncbi:MAG: YbaK/EbsC family protein [Candidatus Omnitrophota bacterium]|nr:YbaK/EbsC family protein [Candidatus Omnitrophota bacterium]
MAISERLQAFLQAAKVPYTVGKHPVAYTAQEIAAAQHVSGRQLAKSVLVKTDRGPVLAVLPAASLIHFKRLKTALKTKRVSIAKEADVKAHFPDVEAGAMAPFGNLYQIPVVIDRMLERSDTMVFNAGSHTETISMRARDFIALVKPAVAEFGQPAGGPPRKQKKRAPSSRRPAKARRTAATRSRATSRPRTRSAATGRQRRQQH